jgi:transposase
MIPAGVQIFLALEPVDMRYGFERLAGLVRERMGYDPRGGALFVFVGKRRQTAKVLFADGTGICLFYKRLDRNTFALPEPGAPDATHLEVDDAALEALLDGLPIAPQGEAEVPPKRRVH